MTWRALKEKKKKGVASALPKNYQTIMGTRGGNPFSKAPSGSSPAPWTISTALPFCAEWHSHLPSLGPPSVFREGKEQEERPKVQGLQTGPFLSHRRVSAAGGRRTPGPAHLTQGLAEIPKWLRSPFFRP